MRIVLVILLPFLGTTLGALLVFFTKSKNSEYKGELLEGFVGGVMLSSSIFSLLIPSIEISKNNGDFFIILNCVFFIIGFLFFILIEFISQKLVVLENGNKQNSSISKMILAIILHNIPEGMAVGVAVSYAEINTSVSSIFAFTLSLGITIQNLPEGAIVSMPLRNNGNSKFYSFLVGSLSGIVEPIFAILTLLFKSLFVKVLPLLLSFSAGTMIYVVVNEVVPKYNNLKRLWLVNFTFSIGFVVMMLLDVLLS